MRFAVVLSLCLCPLLSSPIARAENAAAAGAKGARTKTNALSLLLASDNPDEVRLGIESAASKPGPQTLPLLVQRVRAGLPPELLSAAIDALTALGDPQAGELLVELSQHRRTPVRVQALAALTVLRARVAEAALIAALSDSEAQVRDAAAQGLAEVGTKLSLPPLFKALERGVPSAAVAIGKLAEPSTLPRITAYFGRTSFLNLAPILDAIFMRKDLPQDVKLSLIDAIVKNGSTEARAYLESIHGKLPEDAPPRLRQALADALPRMKK